MSHDVKLTGLADLDQILKSDIKNDIEPMPISKVLFDSIILPLLVGDTTVEMEIDTRFEHLKNIWANYYTKWKESTGELIRKEDIVDKKKPVKIVSGKGVFHPMVIMDNTNKVVDTTPALLEPFTIDNGSELSLHIMSSQNSPMIYNQAVGGINTEVVNSKTPHQSEWSKFINRYYVEPTKENEVLEEENSKYSLGED